MMADIKKPEAAPAKSTEVRAVPRRQDPRVPTQARPGHRLRPGKNRAEVENYLVLGFGGSGQDLQKSFDVTYLGPETINGVATAKLKLCRNRRKCETLSAQILLWIDLDRGVSVQQQVFEPQGDYRLAKYSNIQASKTRSPTTFSS